MKKTNYGVGLWILLMVVFAVLAIRFKEVTAILIAGYVTSFICGIIILQGTVILSNNPPVIAVVTKWGERLWKKRHDNFVAVYVTEGWCWFLLRGFMYGLIPISMIKREHDFPEYILRTPDNATTGVPVGMAYLPSTSHLINYLNLGKNDKERDQMVIDWFDNLLGSELRQWAFSKTEGPTTWEGLNESKDETLDILFARVLGLEIKDTMTEAQKKELKEKKRLVKVGRGCITISHLGIDLIRLNLPPMRPHGPVYEASVVEDVEKKERKSELTEIETDMRKASEMLKLQNQLRAELQKEGIVVTEAELKEHMQTVMKWKVQREGIKNLSLSALVDTIVGSIKGGN